MEVKSVGYFVLVLTIFDVIGQGNSLQCWKCSSDIERACSDRFNISDFYGGNRFYDNNNNYQNRPQYSQQQRQFDPNYNPNYPQSGGNYNPNYNPNYNSNYNRNSMPFLETCDDNDARLRRMRNVCMKQVLRSSTYQTVIRRCAMIPMEQYAGTCQQELPARGLSLDFCEYCEYDGCNSANGVSFNGLLFAGIVTATILGLFSL